MKTIAIYGIIKGYRNCGENFKIETKLVFRFIAMCNFKNNKQ